MPRPRTPHRATRTRSLAPRIRWAWPSKAMPPSAAILARRVMSDVSLAIDFYIPITRVRCQEILWGLSSRRSRLRHPHTVFYSNEVTRSALLLLLPLSVFAQTDWPSFGNDPGAMRYSTLQQINSRNVEHLQPAWTFRTGKPGSEAVPIVVAGVLYQAAPDGIY